MNWEARQCWPQDAVRKHLGAEQEEMRQRAKNYPRTRKRADQTDMGLTGRPPGQPKTGGRKKGTKNKCRKSIDYFADQVFKKVDMVSKGIELLDHKDPRVQAMVWCRLMDYKFGKPREQLVISGSVDMRSIVAQARERVLGITNTSKSLPLLNLPKSDILETAVNQADPQPIENTQQ